MSFDKSFPSNGVSPPATSKQQTPTPNPSFAPSFVPGAAPLQPVVIAPVLPLTQAFNSSFARSFFSPYAPLESQLKPISRTTSIPFTPDDIGSFFDITSGTFTQNFSSPAEARFGWWILLRNSGTGSITLSAAIDNLTSFVMYGQECRFVFCDGTKYVSDVVHPF